MWGTAPGRGSRGPVGAAHGLGKGQGRRQTTSSPAGCDEDPRGTRHTKRGFTLRHGPSPWGEPGGPARVLHRRRWAPPRAAAAPDRSTEQREGAGRPRLHRPAGRQPHHGHVHDTDTERDSHMLSQKETGDCSDTALRTACYAWAGGRGRLQFMAGGAAAGRRPVLSSQLLWPN